MKLKFLRKTIYGALARRIIIVLLCFFAIQLVLGSFFLRQVALRQSTESLQQVTTRVKEDVTYQNGQWDTRRYNADPDLPDTYPLYILSSDGFVIDRWKPLHGLIDTSDVKRLLSYQEPTTITTPTDQTWRIFSKPITQKGESIGVITVSYFNPTLDELASIDKKLYDAVAVISSKLTIKNNGDIDTTNIDPRDVSFDVAFQVVDNFNRIVTKNNNTNSIDRIPNYIDTSYVGNALNQKTVRQVKDSMTGEEFLLVTAPIIDQNNFVVGVVVVGKSIAFIDQIQHNFIVAEIASGLVLVVALTILTLKVTEPLFERVKRSVPAVEERNVDHISFDKKACTIVLDDRDVPIPYATNQFYLCEALFAQPRKRWEVDELLERFGEQDLANWRKVYDAMIMVNKKVAPILHERIFIARGKTFQFNASLLEKLV